MLQGEVIKAALAAAIATTALGCGSESQSDATPGIGAMVLAATAGDSTEIGSTTDVTSYAKNYDGRLQVFFVRPDHSLVTSAQQTPGGAYYSNPTPIATGVSAVATARNRDGRLENFVIGTNNYLYHQVQATPGGAFGPLSFLDSGDLHASVVANADGRLQLFIIGSDGHLWTIWQTSPGGAWSGYVQLPHFGTGARDALASARNYDGRLTVVWGYSGSTMFEMHQLTPGGDWSDEQYVGGGYAVRTIAIAANADGRLELFTVAYLTSEHYLQHWWQETPGGVWTDGNAYIGHNIWLGHDGSDVTAVRNASGLLELHYVGTDGNLYRMAQTQLGGSWSASQMIDTVDANPLLGVNGDGRLEDFITDPSGTGLWHLWQTSPGGSWSGTAQLF